MDFVTLTPFPSFLQPDNSCLQPSTASSASLDTSTRVPDGYTDAKVAITRRVLQPLARSSNLEKVGVSEARAARSTCIWSPLKSWEDKGQTSIRLRERRG